MKSFINKYYVVYAIIIITFFVLMLIAFKSFTGPSFYGSQSHGCINLDEGWYLKDGTKADISRLNKNPGAGAGKQYSIFHKLPETLDENVSLLFRSKNVPFQLYIDGNFRYEPYTDDNPIYTKSYGSAWHFIELSPSDSGKILELKTTTVYDVERSSYDTFRIDSGTALILSIINERLTAIITSILLFFIGIILIVADIPINKLQKKNHELLFLGLFAMSIAIWCLVETNIPLFFTGNFPALQILSYISLMLIPVPAMLYVNEMYKPKRLIPVYIILISTSVEFFACLILNLLKILDYRETLRITHIMLGITAVVLTFAIIKKLIEIIKSKTNFLHILFHAVGISSLCLGAITDLIRFYRSAPVDTALFTRSSILVFISCYGASSLQTTVEAVKAGARAKIISQLAYTDGLTGIGNRTAFQEHLSELEEKKNDNSEIGIIMFDVNDLKKVNDNMGHHLGDEMLLNSAKLIRSSFENNNSRCFRIGGDEFVVIMDGENIKECCENAIKSFNSELARFNGLKELPFSISIASGFAIYSGTGNIGNTAVSLADVLKEADFLMYENKKKMKNGLA